MPWRDTSAMNHSNLMIPGARESWRSQLHYESKNIENRRVFFAGDDFEKIFSRTQYSEFFVIFVLETQWKWTNYRWVFNGMLAKPMDFRQYSKTLYFQNHLQQKVLDGFQCFFIHSEAEIVSSHEHLESFNSSDSSLRYRVKASL